LTREKERKREQLLLLFFFFFVSRVVVVRLYCVLLCDAQQQSDFGKGPPVFKFVSISLRIWSNV